jgi:uncharacterized protein YdcH (DUF465 family)
MAITKEDQMLQKPTQNQKPLDDLARRLGLTETERSDTRIAGLLRAKLKLDDEISALVASGAREQRFHKMGKLLGFSDLELASNPKLYHLIQGLLNARLQASILRPKKTGDTTNVKSK